MALFMLHAKYLHINHMRVRQAHTERERRETWWARELGVPGDAHLLGSRGRTKY